MGIRKDVVRDNVAKTKKKKKDEEKEGGGKDTIQKLPPLLLHSTV